MILLIVDDVYKTGTLHLIHDDSHKNLENNLTLAKLCMYYCDHKIIFNLSLFPKIFSSRSLSSSFCRRSSWFQMTRWVRLLFGIEKKQSSCVSFDISKICDSSLKFPGLSLNTKTWRCSWVLTWWTFPCRPGFWPGNSSCVIGYVKPVFVSLNKTVTALVIYGYSFNLSNWEWQPYQGFQF